MIVWFRITAAAVTLGWSGFAWSAAFSVPCQTDGPGGLIDVMQRVQSNRADDVVTLTPGCTYLLTQPASVLSDSSLVGLPVATSSIEGDLEIDGQGARIERAQGAPEFRLMYFRPSRDFTLRNLTLANGVSRGQAGQRGDANGGARALGGAFNGVGGAILSDYASSLTLINCRFIDNQARGGVGGDGTGVGNLDQASGGGGGGVAWGGAVAHIGSGTITISGSAFVNNESIGGTGGGTVLGLISAGGGGGGSGGDGGLVSGPGALGNAGGGGGGAGYSESSLDKGGDGNLGGGGGAGFSPGGARVIDALVRGGTGGRFGGGGGAAVGGAIYLNGGLFNPSLSITNTSFIGNVVQGGSGTLDGGGAAAAGGALYARNTGVVQFQHVTFVNNIAMAGTHGDSAGSRDGASAFGGGAYLATTAGPIQLRNSALADNQSITASPSGAGSAGLGHGQDLLATITSLGYNLVESRQGVTGFSATDMPEFTDPAWIAGPGAVPLYWIPRIDSSLLDAVPLAQCATTTDQRGLPRPSRSGCDVGSVESSEVEIMRVFADAFE
jgi:large repetitive protein